MSVLVDLLRYNRWANARTCRACVTLTGAIRGEGVTRSLSDLLRHVTGVEHNYLALVRGTELPGAPPGDLRELRDLSAQVAEGYLDFLRRADDATLAKTVHIPWLELDLTVARALLQVVVHSIEHRADIATLLTQQNAAAPALDFVFWLKEEGSGERSPA